MQARCHYSRLLKSLGTIFCSSPKGFFPEDPPNMALEGNSPLAKELNSLILRLPQLLKEKQLRKEIDSLNVKFNKNPNYFFLTLTPHPKKSSAQAQTALTILLFLAQGYLHEDPNKLCYRVPAVLAFHINKLCKWMKRPPILTYSDYVLHNWRLIDPAKGFALNNVEPLFTLTGNDNEKWFIKIHIAIETTFNEAIKLAQQVNMLAGRMYVNLFFKSNLHTLNDGQVLNNKVKPKLMKPHRETKNEEELAQLLNKIANIIQDSIVVMKNMYAGLNVNYFFNEYRNYLKGFDHIEEIIGKKVKSENIILLPYTGASGAQSSVLPALDGLLGVQHSTNLRSFRVYMPVEHQNIIFQLEQSSLSKVVKESKSDAVKLAFDNCRQALTAFRLQHFALVKKYIIGPAMRSGAQVAEIKGTGGEPVVTTLMNRTESTMPRARL